MAIVIPRSPGLLEEKVRRCSLKTSEALKPGPEHGKPIAVDNLRHAKASNGVPEVEPSRDPHDVDDAPRKFDSCFELQLAGTAFLTEESVLRPRCVASGFLQYLFRPGPIFG